MYKRFQDSSDLFKYVNIYIFIFIKISIYTTKLRIEQETRFLASKLMERKAQMLTSTLTHLCQNLCTVSIEDIRESKQNNYRVVQKIHLLIYSSTSINFACVIHWPRTSPHIRIILASHKINYIALAFFLDAQTVTLRRSIKAQQWMATWFFPFFCTSFLWLLILFGRGHKVVWRQQGEWRWCLWWRFQTVVLNHVEYTRLLGSTNGKKSISSAR